MKDNYILFQENLCYNTPIICTATLNKAIDTITKTTYGNFIVIDYLDKTIHHSSNIAQYFADLNLTDFNEYGLCFNRLITTPEDHKILEIVDTIIFPFYDKLSENEKINHTINFDVHIISSHNKEILINFKITPFELSSDGKIRKVISNLSLSLKKTAGNIQVSSHLSDVLWTYDFKEDQWIKTDKKKLTHKELDVFRFYIQGLTIPEIAEKIHVSSDTVKWHRRKLFEKLDVKNINEAIEYAVTNNLI